MEVDLIAAKDGDLMGMMEETDLGIIVITEIM
jgi:hypothetical protein